jgi:hypothetical protein
MPIRSNVSSAILRGAWARVFVLRSVQAGAAVAGIAVAGTGISWAVPAVAADTDAVDPAAVKPTSKKGKKQKALINMVERVAFPHEDVETHALVKVPKQPPPPRPGLRHAQAKVHTTARPHVVDSQPGVVQDPTPAPASVHAAAPAPAAPVRPAGPEPTSRPHDVAPETGSKIDAMVAKAFVKTSATAPPPESSIAAAPGTAAPNPDEIATAMKPLRAEVKSACTFGQRGVLTVRVEVAGDGHVGNVTPEGPLAEQPSAACVLDAVRRTKFPASAGSTFRYPFPVR